MCADLHDLTPEQIAAIASVFRLRLLRDLELPRKTGDSDMVITHASNDPESIRVPDNDERRADWGYSYFRAGLHRNPIQDCPQPETPIRTRAYAPGQEDAK